MRKQAKLGKAGNLVVRNINRAPYKQFKEKAVEDNESVGQALNRAMQYWLARRNTEGKPDIKALLKLNGIIRARAKVAWSEQIDRTLYGESD